MLQLLFLLWGWAFSSSALALGDDVLYYTGNGGFGYLSSYTMDPFTDIVTDEGCAVNVTEDKSGFPTDLSSYRVVFLLLNTSSFTTAEIAVMKTFTDGGGVLVLVGDQTGYAYSSTFNSVLSGLGRTSTFKTSAAYDSTCNKLATVATSHTLNASAASPVYAWSGALNVGSGATALYTGVSGQTVAAVEGNVVMFTDMNFFIDDCTLNASNDQLFLNIYAYADSRDTCDLDDDGVDDVDCGGTDCDDCDSSSTAGSDTWYADDDGDGYGDPLDTTLDCVQPTGHVANDDDCNDSSSAIKPSATELAGDNVDQNCDTRELCYYDADNDGYRLTTTFTSPDADCNDSGEAVSSDPTGDCLDSDADTFPGAASLDSTTSCMTDADGDNYGDLSPVSGVTAGTDCNDSDSAIKPSAAEIAGDNVDQNCDSKEVCYIDADNDGYRLTTTVSSSDADCGDSGEALASDPTGDCLDSDADTFPGAASLDSTTSCMTDADGDSYGDSSPVSGVTAGTDCNDSSSAISPSAVEIAGDNVDQNCDSKELCYYDTDNDGYRLTTTFTSSDADCNDSGEAVSGDPSGDCLDSDADTFPGAASLDSTTSCMTDADGDSYGDSSPVSGVTAGTDCDDSDSAIKPSAAEIAGDNIDQNCDSKEVCYVDADNDGYRLTTTVSSSDADCGDSGEALASDPTGECLDSDANTFPGAASLDSTTSCMTDADGDSYGDSSPVSGVTAGTDCDDSSSAINSGATEVCDSVDNNCDGTIDESTAADASTWYRDADGDSYGTSTSTTTSCTEPSGYSDNTDDCDDTDSAISPDADEVCDSVDNDCDGATDESSAIDADIWYRDADSDGYGDADVTTAACSEPSGYLSDDTDCDDADADVYPGAEETSLDGIDSDCDGEDDIDEDMDSYPSADSGGDDCDDGDTTVYPGAPELADGIDNDCDGIVDEGTDYADDDGDGYAPAGGDCDDEDASVHPGAAESADGVDEDCDGTIDEGTDVYDDDGDGFAEVDGDCNDDDALISPDEPEVDGNGIDDDCDGVVDSGLYDEDGDGYLPAGGDCDDEDASVHPGAAESADGVDEDCDGTIDEGTDVYDDDGDGFAEVDGDCDDDDATRFPGAEEVADGIDNDCDDLTDEITDPNDQDGDGYTVDGDGDCDDTSGWVYPGAVEVCDGLDNDCNGTVDDDDICGAVAETPDTDGDGGGSKGCMTVGGASSGLWLVAMLGAFRRRRLGLLAGASLGVAACSRVENSLTLLEPVLEGDTLVDLGDIAVGTQSTLTVSLDSVGTGRVEIEEIVLEDDETGAFSVQDGWPEVLEVDASGEITLQYQPTAAGWHRTQVQVLSDATNGPVQVEVRAHAVEPWVGLWPPRLDFGPVAAGESRSLEVMLTNDGPLTFDVAEASVSAPFSVSLAPFSLSPGAEQVIMVTFSPTGGDAVQAELDISLIGLGTLSSSLLGNDCEAGDPRLHDQDGDGFTTCGGDCDDADATIYPGAIELEDGINQDCDGATDEGTAAFDDDGDGFSEQDGDCDDSTASTRPDGKELAGNGVDDDCDGIVDDGRPDPDGDGFSIDGGDCDDGDASVHPGAAESADGVDEDCDGTVDEGTDVYDDDGDGYAEVDGDCNDSDTTSAPGAAEVADWRDNDCDGTVDEGTDYADDDGDGFSELGGDCDDADDTISPAAREISGDGIDNDCDGSAS